MKRNFFVFLALILLESCFSSVAFSQDIYWNDFENDKRALFSEVESTSSEKAIKEIETFSKNLAGAATYWQMSAQDIQVLRNKGLGYEELIKVILISISANKPKEEIVKRRNRGETFKKICKRYELDYKVIGFHAKKILSEVEIYGAE